MSPAKRVRALHWLLSLPFAWLSVTVALAGNPDVIKASHNDVSPPLSQMVVGASSNGGGSNSQTPTARSTGPMIANPNSDPVAAPFAGPLMGVTAFLNFDGQSAQDNRNLFGFAFVPPDTNGAAGASQFVQMVNVTIAVYDKSSGILQLGPAAIHTLWSGFGGLCEFGGGTPTFADGGDPVVLYDHLAGRWLVTQLQYDTTFTHTAQCLAVSTTSDATGSYSRYEFDFGSNFPDYPKFGIWPDAYYNSINVFPPHSFAGAQACAFDRNAMLADAAIEQANKVLIMDPGNGVGHWILLSAYEGQGDLARAIDEREKQAVLWGQSPENAVKRVAPFRNAYAAAGGKGYWQVCLDSFGPNPEHADPYALATVLARVGDKTRAFAYLEKSYAVHSDEFLYSLQGEPAFDSMRADPRFKDLLSRIGL
jgi:hypothetical protein